MTSHVPAKHLDANRDVLWNEVHALSKGRINLGHGCPEEGVHEGVLKALVEISSDPEKYVELQQYSLLMGHPPLLKALSKFYSPLFKKQLDQESEILVTPGASFSLYCAIQGLINPGDEVIIMEPFYEQYPFVVEQARGKPVFIPLRPKEGKKSKNSDNWHLDMQELESKFSSKTKMMVINNPHNPLGKVFTRSELQQIGDLAKKYDIVLLMDEVYEFLVYEGHEHVRMATLPEMWERTMTVSSAGKLFGITGWRIGWTIAPPHLIKCSFLVHQDSTRTCQTNLQDAIAKAIHLEIPLLGTEKSYWRRMTKMLKAKRDMVAEFTASVGMEPNIPNGSYFIVTDISELASKIELNQPGDTKDFKFFRWLALSKGLICVPMSAFYSKENKHLGENYVRFCFIKKDSTLEKAEKILVDVKSTYF